MLVITCEDLCPTDAAANGRARSAFSNLACLNAPAVLEAEINPLIVKAAGEGVVAVNGVVRIDTAG